MVQTSQASGRQTNSLAPRLALLLAVLLWGGSYPAMKVAVTALGPWTVMWLRMILAAFLLSPVILRLRPHLTAPTRFGGHSKPLRADALRILAMVLCMPCGYFLMEANALRFTSAAQAGVVSSLVPLLVACGARLLLGERHGLGTWLGLGISVAGVVWLTLTGTVSAQASRPLLGNMLEVGAMICAAGSMLLLKELSSRYGPWPLTAMQVIAGVVFFVPGAMGLMQRPPWTWSALETGAILYLGCFVSVGAFGLYNYGMSRLAASQASAFINLVPVAAVLLGWGLLGETLTPMQWVAAGCVFAGVWLSQHRRGASSLGSSAATAPAGRP